MIIAAPNTGVIIANILKANKVPIVTNGINTLLCLIPGIHKVLLVINKLVNETVLLTPANITDTNNKSCAPIPVYLTFEENGVIKVQPAVVSVRFEHLVK